MSVESQLSCIYADCILGLSPMTCSTLVAALMEMAVTPCSLVCGNGNRVLYFLISFHMNKNIWTKFLNSGNFFTLSDRSDETLHSGPWKREKLCLQTEKHDWFTACSETVWHQNRKKADQWILLQVFVKYGCKKLLIGRCLVSGLVAESGASFIDVVKKAPEPRLVATPHPKAKEVRRPLYDDALLASEAEPCSRSLRQELHETCPHNHRNTFCSPAETNTSVSGDTLRWRTSCTCYTLTVNS